MDQIILRVAGLGDLETLLRFEQGVIVAERPFDATLKSGQIHYYNLEEMIQASHIQLLVAELNHEPIASGYARIENAKHYLQHPQHAYLGFMYTVPQHRGKGINQKIMQALKEWAATQNITEFRLDVYAQNASAIRAYEKSGFVAHMLEMRSGLVSV